MRVDHSAARAVRAAGAAVALTGCLLAGCATPPSDPVARAAYEQTNDPLEPLNRKTFAVNQVIDRLVLRPAAKAYVTVIPEEARKAVHRVLDNMKEPTLFFDNVLQGEFKRAELSLGRFLVNSTVGFGGLVDVMSLSGVERQPADFGQTMYVWGIPSGPYLILPILGPTNPRDAIGSTVDSYADPFTIVANDHAITMFTTARILVGGADERAGVLDELDDLEKHSVDFYAQMRSLWQQHRAAELQHGKRPEAAPGLYDDPGQSAPGQSAPNPGQGPGTSAPAPSPAKAGAVPVAVRQATATPPANRLPAKAAPARQTAAPQEANAKPTATPEPTVSTYVANAMKQIATAVPDTRGLDFEEDPAR